MAKSAKPELDLEQVVELEIQSQFQRLGVVPASPVAGITAQHGRKIVGQRQDRRAACATSASSKTPSPLLEPNEARSSLHRPFRSIPVARLQAAPGARNDGPRNILTRPFPGQGNGKKEGKMNNGRDCQTRRAKMSKALITLMSKLQDPSQLQKLQTIMQRWQLQRSARTVKFALSYWKIGAQCSAQQDRHCRLECQCAFAHWASCVRRSHLAHDLTAKIVRRDAFCSFLSWKTETQWLKEAAKVSTAIDAGVGEMERQVASIEQVLDEHAAEIICRKIVSSDFFKASARDLQAQNRELVLAMSALQTQFMEEKLRCAWLEKQAKAMAGTEKDFPSSGKPALYQQQILPDQDPPDAPIATSATAPCPVFRAQSLELEREEEKRRGRTLLDMQEQMWKASANTAAVTTEGGVTEDRPMGLTRNFVSPLADHLDPGSEMFLPSPVLLSAAATRAPIEGKHSPGSIVTPIFESPATRALKFQETTARSHGRETQSVNETSVSTAFSIVTREVAVVRGQNGGVGIRFVKCHKQASGTDLTEMERGRAHDSRRKQHVCYAVTHLVSDGAALSSGLLAVGDYIWCVDGCQTASLSVDDMTSRIKGAPGTAVVLSISSAGGSKPPSAPQSAGLQCTNAQQSVPAEMSSFLGIASNAGASADASQKSEMGDVSAMEVVLQRDNAGGVGIRIARSSHFSNVYVISGMREDGPAEQSGEILDGDILLSVNSQSVSVLSVKDVAGLICGPAGSFVRLIVARPCPQGMSDAPPSRPSHSVSLSHAAFGVPAREGGLPISDEEEANHSPQSTSSPPDNAALTRETLIGLSEGYEHDITRADCGEMSDEGGPESGSLLDLVLSSKKLPPGHYVMY